MKRRMPGCVSKSAPLLEAFAANNRRLGIVAFEKREPRPTASNNAPMQILSVWKLFAKHWISALRLLSRGFVLNHIPVFGQEPVFNSYDVGNNPVRRQAGV